MDKKFCQCSFWFLCIFIVVVVFIVVFVGDGGVAVVNVSLTDEGVVAVDVVIIDPK